MNKSNADNSSGERESIKPKSLTPAILGVSSSHGAKLSRMTSEDKKEFMQKLEEWRKARREKLAAKILAKQKLAEKPKPTVNFAPPKAKPTILQSGGILKPLDKESVFERLYKGNGKFKKAEVIENSTTFTKIRNIKKTEYLTSKKPLKMLPDGNSKANEYDFVEEEIFSDFADPSNKAKINSIIKNPGSPIQETLETAPNVTVSTSEIASQVTGHKHLGSDSLESKGTVIKKQEIKKPTSKLTEGALKNYHGKVNTKVECEKSRIPLRRSISMLFRQKSKTETLIRRSFSAKNIRELESGVKSKIESNGFNTKNETTTKSVSFDTPKAKQMNASTHLRTKLENWLKVNGHPLEGYRHLRCFGIESNRTPQRATDCIETEAPTDNFSYSAASDSPPDESNKENATPPPVVLQVDVMQVENWLKELRLLIADLKYPSERCEEWLAAIRKKYPKCTQLPIYWECLAALNESKGDVKSAIEDYERAIIKGGQVDSVGNSLAHLFDKMVIEQKKSSKSKLEKGIDPKNIFKSTIIKFALQQKTLRKLGPQIEPSVREQLYVATPVRRSTRIQTPFKPKEVASLETLTPELKKNLTFKLNESLLETD